MAKTITTYDKAVGRANENDASKDPEAVSLETIANACIDADAFKLDVKAIAEAMASGHFEAAEQLLTIEAGMMVKGQLLSRGETHIESKNPEERKNGILTTLSTYQMRLASGARISFLGAAQLDRMLPQYLGRKGETIVARAYVDRKLANGKNMGEYFVAGPPPNAAKLLCEAEPAGGSSEDLIESKR